MNCKINLMDCFLKNQIDLCKQQAKALFGDERIDEANLQKIKVNVYDIFRTVLSVAQRTGNDDLESVKRFFLVKTEEISSRWKAAYEMSKKYDDTEKILVEKIKLDTATEIRNKFLSCWEETE